MDRNEVYAIFDKNKNVLRIVILSGKTFEHGKELAGNPLPLGKV